MTLKRREGGIEDIRYHFHFTKTQIDYLESVDRVEQAEKLRTIGFINLTFLLSCFIITYEEYNRLINLLEIKYEKDSH